MANSSGQVHGAGGRPEEDAPEAMAGAGQAQLGTQGAEELLDEIDGLLEDNAEEFVNAYVQKGGQ